MGDFCWNFESFPRQATQMISKFDCGVIRSGSGLLIPAAQFRAQSCGEKMLHRLVDSGRVIPFEHLIKIMCGDQSTDLAQVPGSITGLDKVAVITLLQLGVLKVHDASLSVGLARMV